jgi:uncharacterized protein (UPF0216 family)
MTVLFNWTEDSETVLREREISKADDDLDRAFCYLTELLAEKDPRYATNDGYPKAMEDSARELLETLSYRLKNGGLI